MVRWMYDSLYEMNIECDVIDVNRLKSSDYDMIITLALYCASNDTIAKLKSLCKKVVCW